MALDHMSVKPAVKTGAPFQVNLVARLQEPEIGLVECLADGGDCVGVTLLLYHCKADTIVRHALVYLQLMGK